MSNRKPMVTCVRSLFATFIKVRGDLPLLTF